MRKPPAFANLEDMEEAAHRDEQQTASLRLWWGGFTSTWLTVFRSPTGYVYTSLVGRYSVTIPRYEAERLVAREWEPST